MSGTDRLKSDRPRAVSDFYETPYGLIEGTKLFLKPLFDETYLNSYPYYLDPGCGNGRWGECIKDWYANKIWVDGIDIEERTKSPAYTSWAKGNFLACDFGDLTYDFVGGNFPFGSAEEFILKSLECTVEGGYVFSLLRLNFWGSQRRHWGLFDDFKPIQCWVSSRRPSFFSANGGGKTTDNFEYAMFIWQKGNRPDYTKTSTFYWNYDKRDK